MSVKHRPCLFEKATEWARVLNQGFHLKSERLQFAEQNVNLSSLNLSIPIHFSGLAALMSADIA